MGLTVPEQARASRTGREGGGRRVRRVALALLIVAGGVLALGVLSTVRAGADATHYDLSLRVRGVFGDGHNPIEFEGKRFDEVVAALEATDSGATPAGEADATLGLSPDGFADVNVEVGRVTVSNPGTGDRLIVVRGRTSDWFDRSADLLATAKWKSDVDTEPELGLFFRYEALDGQALDLSTFEPSSPEIDFTLNLAWVAVSRNPSQGTTPEGKPIGITVDPDEFAAIDPEVEAYFDDGIDDNADSFEVLPTYIPPPDVPYYDASVPSEGVSFRTVPNPNSPLTDAAAALGFSREIRVEGSISLSSIYGETCHGIGTGYSTCTRPSENRPTSALGLELSAQFKSASTPSSSVPEEVRLAEGWTLTVRGDTAGNVTVTVDGTAIVGAGGEEFNLGGQLRFERDTVTGFVSVKMALRAENLELGPFTFKLLEGSFVVTKPTEATGAVTTTPSTTTTTVAGSGGAKGRFTLTATLDTKPIFGFEGEVSLALTFAQGLWQISGNVATEDGSGILSHLMPNVELPLHFDIEDFGFAFTKINPTTGGSGTSTTTTTSTTLPGDTKTLGARTEWTFTGSVKIDPLGTGSEFDADFLIIRSQPAAAASGGIAPKPDWLVVVKLGPDTDSHVNMRLRDLVDNPPFDFDLPDVFLSYATRVFQQQPEFLNEAVKAFVENQDGRFANYLRYQEGFAARADIKPAGDFEDALEKLLGKEVEGALRLNLFNIAAGPGAWGLEIQLPAITADDADASPFRALELKVVGGKIWADVGKDTKVPSTQFGIDGKVALAIHKAHDSGCTDRTHPGDHPDCFDEIEFRVALALSASPTTGFQIQGRGGIVAKDGEGWENPLGIKGLTVHSLQVVVGVTVGPPDSSGVRPGPVLTLGMGGGLDIETDANGDGTIDVETERRTLSLAFLLDIQTTPPWVVPQGFTFAINRLELRDLATLHNMLVDPSQQVNIAGAFPDVRLEDVYFAYGAVDEPTLCIRQGFYLAAELHYGSDPNDTPDGAEACNGQGNIPPSNPPTSAHECEQSTSCVASVLIDVQLGATVQTVANTKVVIQGYFAGANLGPAIKLSPTLVDLSLSANSVHFRMQGGGEFHIVGFSVLSGEFLIDLSPTHYELWAEATLVEDFQGGLAVFEIYGLADFTDFDDIDWDFKVSFDSPGLVWLGQQIETGFNDLKRTVRKWGDDLQQGLNDVGTDVRVGWSKFTNWFSKAFSKEPTAGEILHENWKELRDMCANITSSLDAAEDRDDVTVNELFGFCRSAQEIWEAAIFGATLADFLGPHEVPEGEECEGQGEFLEVVSIVFEEIDIVVDTWIEDGQCMLHLVMEWTGFCNLAAGQGHAVCAGGRTPPDVVENLVVPGFVAAATSAAMPVDLAAVGTTSTETLQALHGTVTAGASAVTCASFSYNSETGTLSDLSAVVDVDGTERTIGVPIAGGLENLSGQDLFQESVEALVHGSDPDHTCEQDTEGLASEENRDLFLSYFTDLIALTLRASDDKTSPTVYSIEEGGTVWAHGTVVGAEAPTVWIDWGYGSQRTSVVAGEDGSWSASHRYLDDGNYEVTVDVGETYGPSEEAVVRSLDVTNVAPTAPSRELTASAQEGDEVVLRVDKIEDPGIADAHRGTVYWDDGTSSFLQRQEDGSLLATHVYDDEGASRESSAVRTVSLVVADDDGGRTTYDMETTIHNAAPHTKLNIPSSATEGVAIEGELVVTDPGIGDWVVVWVDWADGTTQRIPVAPNGTDTRTVPVSHTWLDDDPTGSRSDMHLIGLQGYDGDDGRFNRTVEIIVWNTVPSVSIEAVGAETTTVPNGSTVPVVDEGAASTWRVTVDDIGVLDSHDVVVDWGDGSTDTVTIDAPTDGSRQRSAEVTHTWVDDDPTGTPQDLLTVSVRATDDDTGSSEASTAVMVRNVAPTVSIAPVAEGVDEASELSWTVTVDDVGTLDTHTVVVDWGDGTTSTVDVPADPGGATTRTAEVSHTWVDDDPTATPEDVITVTATATDDDTGVGSGTGTVTVRNVAPTVSITPVGEAVVDEASSLAWTVTVDDVGVADSHTVTVDWGDGTQGTVEVPADPGGAVTRTAEVVYTPVDDHPATGTPEDLLVVSVSVVDDDTGSATGADQSVTVRNVAPTITALDLSATELDENESSVDLRLDFADVGVADTHTVTVDWGDGWSAGTGVDADASGHDVRTTEVGVAANGSVDRSVTLTNRYGDNGTYTIAVTLRDDDTGQAADSRTLVVGNVGPTHALDRSTATDTAGGPTWLLQTGQSQAFSTTAADPGSDDLRFDWGFGDGTSTSPWWRWATGGFGDTSTDPLPSPQVGPVNPTSTVTHAWAQACLYGLSTQVTDDDGAATGVEYGAVAVPRAPDGTGPRNFAQWRAAIHDGEISQAELDCYLDVAGHLSSVALGRSELDDASSGGDPTPWSVANGSVDATARNGGGVPVVLDDPPGPGGDKLAQEQAKFDRALLAVWLSYADGAFGWDQVVDGGQAFHVAMAELEGIRRTSTDWKAVNDAWQRLNAITSGG